MPPTDLRGTDTPVFAGVSQAELLAEPVTTVDQRLDRVSLGLDNIADAVAALVDRLRPVLAANLVVDGDDQPEQPADGTAQVTVRLHRLQANAHYLGDKVRAITKAVEL